MKSHLSFTLPTELMIKTMSMERLFLKKLILTSNLPNNIEGSYVGYVDQSMNYSLKKTVAGIFNEKPN